MKKRLLQIGSLLMALVVLFVSVGWDVKFHYCTAEHHLSGSFGEAAESCLHCHDHEHEHEAHFAQQHETQFNAKCCCEDFERKIQFTDNYVFSPEKHLIISLQSCFLPHLDLKELCAQVSTVFRQHSPRKTLKFLSGRERIVFFSSLKLNPLVF
ncbi:MAG: hypothetical protein IKZ55_04220 [Bacteroidales bacterium]|nr:hypothetical protein [Bacteroidales bacterium]